MTRNDEPLDPATIRAATTRTANGNQLALELEGTGNTALRVQVQDPAGLKSWPRFVTVAFD